MIYTFQYIIGVFWPGDEGHDDIFDIRDQN